MYRELVTTIEPKNKKVTHEGGVAFGVGPLHELRRFLILGASGTFYVGRKVQVERFRELVTQCLTEDYDATLAMVRDISHRGLALSNEPALFTLAVASTMKGKWEQTFHTVVRTGTHLLHFMAYVDGKRGWGRSLRRAVADWFRLRDANQLAYQAIKYKSRDGWSLADALRLSHPNPVTPEHSAVMKWIVDGEYPMIESVPAQIVAANAMQISTLGASDAAALIRATRLPREAVRTDLLNEREVWDALLDDMPMTAMIRNLPKMTEVGLLTRSGDATKRVILALTDEERLRKARIHPIQVLLAMKVYARGHGHRSSKMWTPVPIIVDALDAAFYASFGNVPVIGKPLMLGVDSSGSMTGYNVADTALSVAEAAAAMALITASVESDCRVVFFDTRLMEAPITKRQRLDDVVKMVHRMGGGTMTHLIPQLARTSPEAVDGLVIYTDSETHSPNTYPELVKLRKAHGQHIRAACVGLVANDVTLWPEEDKQCLGIAGFGADVPGVLHAFLTGDI